MNTFWVIREAEMAAQGSPAGWGRGTLDLGVSLPSPLFLRNRNEVGPQWPPACLL